MLSPKCLACNSFCSLEHVELYSENIKQYQLQESFYALYEPEILACTSVINLQLKLSKNVKSIRLILPLNDVERLTAKNNGNLGANSSGSSAITGAAIDKTRLQFTSYVKDLDKRFRALAKGYLLDTLDLNTKCRCIYSWTGTCRV